MGKRWKELNLETNLVEVNRDMEIRDYSSCKNPARDVGNNTLFSENVSWPSQPTLWTEAAKHQKA